MSKLGQIVESIEKYNKFVLDQVKRARTDEQFGRELLGRWNDTKAKIPVTRTPTGVPLPRLALPEIDEAGEIAYHRNRLPEAPPMMCTAGDAPAACSTPEVAVATSNPSVTLTRSRALREALSIRLGTLTDSPRTSPATTFQ